ncbi:MAG: TadE/TadG family type IV pilus assembly protein [Pseudorhodobacter sp.]
MRFPIPRIFYHFARDCRGSIIVEALLVLPVLIWAHAALFVYWDAYRTINEMQKATYSISDLISRTQLTVDDAYLDGIHETLNYILNENDNVTMRVTSFLWDEADAHYKVIWSHGSNPGPPALTNETIKPLASKLPDMSDGDSAILVETTLTYEPPLNFGLNTQSMQQFIVTRPRFLPKICHSGVPCS